MAHPTVIPFKQPEAIDPLQAILKRRRKKAVSQCS